MAKQPVADEIHEVLPGCYTWQAFCSQAKVELTSHSINDAGHIYLVDPIRLNKSALVELENLEGTLTAVLLTNGNHERDAAFYSDRLQIPIYAQAEADLELSFTTTPYPKHIGGLKILPLPGAGPGEVGIYDAVRKFLCLGDIIINLDSFAFAPLPAKYASDSKIMRQSIHLLTRLDVATICFAHGLPIIGNARDRLGSLAF